MNLSPDRHRDRLVAQFGFGLVVLLGLYMLQVAFPTVIPGPVEILAALETQIMQESLAGATIHALQAIFIGYFVAVAVGIPLGLLMGSARIAEEFFDPYLYALYVTPFSALVPAFIIWFGTGLTVRLVIVFFFAVFPITINTHQGTKGTPTGLINAVRSFGGGRWFLLRNVIVPHEIPYIVAGLRIGIGRAVKGLIVAELLVSVSGFGRILTRWSSSFQLEGVFSVVLVLMAIGVVLTWAVKRVEEWVVHWDTASI